MHFHVSYCNGNCSAESLREENQEQCDVRLCVCMALDFPRIHAPAKSEKNIQTR